MISKLNKKRFILNIYFIKNLKIFYNFNKIKKFIISQK